MARLLLILAVSLLPFSSFAEMKSAKALTVKQTKTSLTGDLKGGFHFNERAPNAVVINGESMKPKVLKTRHIEFALKGGAGEAMLYVCDDALTFCETHTIEIKGDAKATAPSPGASKKKTGKGSVDAHGFIHDDVEKGLALGAEKKQPVILEFSAKWCPGCVRYEKETFPTTEFAKITEGFVKVSIDVDRFENFGVGDKYKIRGIPSMVVVNGQGDEIDRLVDFVPMEKLKTFFDAVKADPTPIAELLARKNVKDPAERLRIGKRLLATDRFNEATEWLAPLKPAPPEFLSAKVQAAVKAAEDDEKKKDAAIAVLRSAIKEESESSRSIGWRGELAKLLPKDSADSKQLFADARALVDRFLADDALLMKATSSEDVGEFAGYERLLVLFELLDMADNAGAPEAETKAIWKKAVEVGAAYKIPPEKSGPALRYLIVLNYAEMYPEAEAHANALLKTDPSNLDVQRRIMKPLLAQKKFSQAQKVGEKIIDRVVGRNQFWVAQLLAEAYAGQNKKTDAKKLLQAYLARPEISEPKMKGTKKGMEDLLKTVQ